MARSKIALKDFLSRHCLIQPAAIKVEEEEYYVLHCEGGRFFMAQAHIKEILRAIGQTDETTAAAKRSGDFTGILLVYWKEAPENGVDKMKIPLKLVDGLSEQQASLVLRNLEGIEKDAEDGKMLKDRLESLFQDTASIAIDTADNGDRIFNIMGKLSSTDHRRYMERYAEQIASKTLFDIAKALNAKLEQYVPEELREKFFVEGRDFSDRKIRYGQEVNTELALTDEGAWIYTNIASKSPHLREIIVKLFRQAMLDPFGLSLTHYMGKHNVLKAGKRPLVKIPGLSSFFGWLKGLFGGKKEE